MTMPTRGHAPGGSGEDGAVIVEFAAIFIVFAMLLWGLISYGVIFAAQQSLTHGASEAARSTVGMSDAPTAQAHAVDILDEELTWLAEGIDAKDATVAQCDNDPMYDCMTVTVTYDWAGHPIVPSILNVATPDTLSGRAVVQFR